MALQYISIDIEIPQTLDQYVPVIEAAIAQHGDPIRWAVTRAQSNQLRVNAVVDQLSSSPTSDLHPFGTHV